MIEVWKYWRHIHPNAETCAISTTNTENMVNTEAAKSIFGIQNLHFEQDRLLKIKIREKLFKDKTRETQK